jgi:hypothetical protein
MSGRIQVSPGQTIQSAQWGNIVFDQSVIPFLNAADRDAQWPAPKEGAVCYLLDVHRLYLYEPGGWQPVYRAKAQRYSVSRSASNVAVGAYIDFGLPANTEYYTGVINAQPASQITMLKPALVQLNGSVSGAILTGTNVQVVAAGLTLIYTPNQLGGNQFVTPAIWTGLLNTGETLAWWVRNGTTGAANYTMKSFLTLMDVAVGTVQA